MLLSAASMRAKSSATQTVNGGNLVQESLDGIYSAIEASEYEINWQPEFGAFMAPNRANNLRFLFLDNGFKVTRREPKPDDPAIETEFFSRPEPS
jgi:hypothetical protein